MICRICGNVNENKTYRIREMMYGFKDVFQYFQCSVCKCLQIKEYPLDMTKYYRNNYHSAQMKVSPNKIKKYFISLRDNYAAFNRGFIGKLLNMKFPVPQFHSFPLAISLNKGMNILDIGCGNGNLLFSLSQLGFNNLLGIDPFIDKNIKYDNGLKIMNIEIYEVQGTWDIIMFHHSFEHIPFQAQILQTVSELLALNGHCVIAIPITSSYAWEHYGVNWVQLDAPRHFYLHSIKSMKILAGQVGLELCNVEYNSTAFQFWGSEQYLNDIPLLDKRSFSNGKDNSIFSKKELSAYTKHAKILNENQNVTRQYFTYGSPVQLIKSLTNNI